MQAPLERDIADSIIRKRLQEAARDALAAQLRRTHAVSPVARNSSPAASAASRAGLLLPLPLPVRMPVDASVALPRPLPSATITVRLWLASGLGGVAARLDPGRSVADASLVVLKAR